MSDLHLLALSIGDALLAAMRARGLRFYLAPDGTPKMSGRPDEADAAMIAEWRPMLVLALRTEALNTETAR